MPGALLQNFSLLKRDGSLRTQTGEDVSLVIDGDHAEAQGSAPKNEIVNQITNQLAIQAGEGLI